MRGRVRGGLGPLLCARARVCPGACMCEGVCGPVCVTGVCAHPGVSDCSREEGGGGLLAPALTPLLGACLPPPPSTRSHTHTPRPPRTPGPGPHPASPPPIPPPWVRFASERARAVRGVSDTGQRMLAAPPMGPSRRARPRPSTPCTPASLSGPWRSGCLCAARRNARAQSRPNARHSLPPSSPLGRSLSFFSPPLIPSLFFSLSRPHTRRHPQVLPVAIRAVPAGQPARVGHARAGGGQPVPGESEREERGRGSKAGA